MNSIKNLKLTWLSPETVKKLSFGEIINHGILDVRTLKPKLGGLFDPKIFGYGKSYECFCGKYKNKNQITHKNQKCERCKVLLSNKNIQRWRMGHIQLRVPVTNILLFKNLSNILSKIIGISTKNLEDIIYFKNYIVTKEGISKVIREKRIINKDLDIDLILKGLNEVLELQEQKLSDLENNKENKEKDKEKEKTEENDEEIEDEIELKNEQDGKAEKEDNKEVKKINLEIKKIKKLILNLDKENSKDKTISNKVIFLEDYFSVFRKFLEVEIKTGSEAFLDLLSQIDVKKEVDIIDNNKKIKKNNEKYRFFRYLLKSKLDLSWIIFKSFPVIPAGLRPVTVLKKEISGDKDIVVTTQINNLYRKIILANDNLDYYLNNKEGVFFGEVVIQNAKKRLQKSIDRLLLGSIKKQVEIKGLVKQLSGKDGILRHFSLGKRTDYSGRAVVSPSAELKLDEIKMPIKMLLTTFRSLIIKRLLSKKIAFTVKEAIEIINNETFNTYSKEKHIIIEILNEICKEHLVIFNRAPSLHRLSIQAAYPKLSLTNTIGLHPLVTTALNADFDGDAIEHLALLTTEEITEAKERLLSTKQIMDPKNGQLITVPKQDIVLGIYFLTKEIKGDKLKVYTDIDSAIIDYEQKRLELYHPIIIPLSSVSKENKASNKFFFTTIGKILFNRLLEGIPNLGFINDLDKYNELEENYYLDTLEINELESAWDKLENYKNGWKKKDIINFLNSISKNIEPDRMVELLDEVKEIGFKYANLSGISISPFELGKLVTKDKKEYIVSKSFEKIKQIKGFLDQGLISEIEFINKTDDIWQECKDELQKILIDNLKTKTDSSFFQIWSSEARISSENLVQLFAMRGRVVNYLGEIMEMPIISSLWDGLNPFESLTLNYGMRKGMIDKSLMTAEAGYLTRRLVESAQELIIKKDDCGTKEFAIVKIDKTDIYTTVYSRVLSEDVVDNNNDILIEKNTLITDKHIKILLKNLIEEVKIFTVLKCRSINGICIKCYGGDLGKSKLEKVELGTAVGIIAAQSLGEPGTQLTMRTFHTGGISAGEDIVQGLPKVKQILDNLKVLDNDKAILSTVNGIVKKVDEKLIQVEDKENNNIIEFTIKSKDDSDRVKKILVREGAFLKKGDKLTNGEIELEELLNISDIENTQNYIQESIKKVYNNQGIDIHNKHIEIFAKQTLSKVTIISSKDNDNYLPGDVVLYNLIKEENEKLKEEEKQLIEFKINISSLKTLASTTSSFLASASFQNSLRSLINYSVFNPVDSLENPKTSLIIGQLPAIGTGFLERQKLMTMSELKLKNTTNFNKIEKTDSDYKKNMFKEEMFEEDKEFEDDEEEFEDKEDYEEDEEEEFEDDEEEEFIEEEK